MFKAYIMIILLLGMMIFPSCNSKKSTEPKTEDLNVTFTLSATSGKPGEILKLTPDKDLESLGKIALYFGDKQAPLIKTDAQNYTIMVPLIDPEQYKIFLKNTETGAVSQSVDFSVNELPPTNEPPGKIIADLNQLNNNTVTVLKTAVIPVLKSANVFNDTDNQLINEELNRLSDALNKLQTEINNLPEDQKRQLDALLNSAGIAGLLSSQNQMLKKISTLQNTNKIYYLHSLLVSLDGLSAILTAVKEVTGMISFVSAILTLGASAPLSATVMILLSSIDNIIDGCLPTDLAEIYVENDPLKIPYNGQKNVVFKGKFVTQSNPLNASINIVLDALFSGIKNKSTKQAIMNKIYELLTKIGLSVADNLTNLTENWQNVRPVYTEINPYYYTQGADAFRALMQSSFGFNIPAAKPFNFVNLISGTNYHIEDNTIASFDVYNSVINGKNLGTSNLIYGGYCFKEPDGGLLGDVFSALFVLELPEKLSDEQIEDAPITVESMDPNTVQISSEPSGADIYLDGTNMNKVTPAVFENVPAGQHHIRLYKRGYNEYNTSFTMSDGGTIIINANLGEPLPPLPVFTIDQPLNNQHFSHNVITVSGSIHLEDAFGNQSLFTGASAILTLNGVEQEIPVIYGSFSQDILIHSGENRLQLRANSENGDTGVSDELVIYGDFSTTDIQIVLRWNNGTEQNGDYTKMKDVDLHVYDSEGHHTYWLCSDQYSGSGHDNAVANMIPGSKLDIDNTWGFGPETFTLKNATNTIYTVKAHFYAGYDPSDPTYANIEITLKDNNSKTYGPYLFKNSYKLRDSNGDYIDNTSSDDPDCWWNVLSFTISNGLPKVIPFNETITIPKNTEPIKSKSYYSGNR